MKLFVLTLFTLLTFSVSSYYYVIQNPIQYSSGVIGGDSGGPKLSWKEILTNPGLKAAFPSVLIQGYLVEYNYLCLDTRYVEDVVRTKYKIEVFDKNSDTRETFFSYLFNLPTPESFDCEEKSISCHSDSIPRKIDVHIFRANRKRTSREVLFTKSYELPYCQ